MPIRGLVRLENLYVQSVTALSAASLASSFLFRWHKILAHRDRADATRSRYLLGSATTDGREIPMHNRTGPTRIRAQTKVAKCLGELERLGGDLSVVSLGIHL